MADYLQILQGITGGLQAGQNFRANRQIEKAREQALESGEYDLQARRATRRTRDPESARVLGALDPSTVQDYQQTFGDPFAFKLVDWFKQRAARRRKVAAVQSGDAPMYEQPTYDQGQQYADGGMINDGMTDEERQRKIERDMYIQEQEAAAAQRRRDEQPARAAAAADARAKNGGVSEDTLARLQKRERVNALNSMINEAAAPVLGPGLIPTEKLYSSGGPRTRGRARSALPVEEPASASDAPAETPAAALPVGNTAAPAPAQRRAAVPTDAGPQPPLVDFSKIDAEAKDVPNMTTDDWREYRAKVVDAARLSGRPEAIAQANNLVTQMQQQGFLSYGQQGLALQQAGNLKGAMAAYRAAFQYFPNGNDVEFGLVRDRQGQQQIVGYGRDEKTHEVVQGSQIVLNPEQAARLLENFSKPEAFRAWTKDWRDFEESKRRFDATMKNKEADDRFRERKYSEVEKPLAQAQADSLANRSEADILRAEKAGQAGGLKPRDLQGSERTFRERLELVGLTDEGQKDYLASVMSQIKTASPNTPDNVIIDSVMRAQKDGTLAQRLKAMGIQ